MNGLVCRRWLRRITSLKKTNYWLKILCVFHSYNCNSSDGCYHSWVWEMYWSRKDFSTIELPWGPWPWGGGVGARAVSVGGLPRAPAAWALVPLGWQHPVAVLGHGLEISARGLLHGWKQRAGDSGWLFLLPCKCFFRRWVPGYDVWVTWTLTGVSFSGLNICVCRCVNWIAALLRRHLDVSWWGCAAQACLSSKSRNLKYLKTHKQTKSQTQAARKWFQAIKSHFFY